MNLTAWLRKHQLEQHEAALVANDIDLEVARSLTEADLRELGFSLGVRKRFLAAIAALTSEAVEPPRALASTGTERRQLTVLFCDLVGSVALSHRLDPEALRSLLARYRSACAAVISRFEGHVARYVGDGVLAYFGWPQAHEDDAERAVRAALELVATVRSMPTDEALAVHIGVATGPVVVGQEAGEAPEARLAVGPTPNLAARLQGLAGAGEILLNVVARRLIGESFRVVDRGDTILKGIDGPVRVFAVEGHAVSSGRFEALHQPATLTPLIGRDEELALLAARWRFARDGEGQAITVCGEAGIGKSRLLHRLIELIAHEDRGYAHIVRCQCTPYHIGSPLYPIVDYLERAAGVRLDDTHDVRRKRVERFLQGLVAEQARAARLIGDLLGLPNERDTAPHKASTTRKAQTLAILIELFRSLAAERPLLVVIEDAHWIDSATRDLLDALIPQLPGLAALLVVTTRSDGAPLGAPAGHVTTLTLNRLTRRQSAEMLRRLGGDRDWDAALLKNIVAHTDGVPLFIEELWKTLAEGGAITAATGHYVPTGSLSALTIPATLQDSLTARLDRLGPSKEIAQIAACFGHEFEIALLATAAGMAAEKLATILDVLVGAQIVVAHGGVSGRYVFKHALIRDTAYQSLVEPHRRRIHSNIAAALLRFAPEEVAARPELVAFHLDSAGESEQSLDYWERAGELAVTRSAYVEAIGHFGAALAALVGRAPSDARDIRELGIRVKLGPAYQAVKGMASPEAGENYERASRIGASIDAISARAETFQGLWGHWLFCNLTGRSSAARERADQLVALSARLSGDEFALQAHHARWTTFQNLGDFATTRADVERGLKLYDSERHRHHAHIYGGHDPGVCCHTQGAMCLWVYGEPARAHRMVDAGIALARSLGHPFSLAVGLWFGGAVKQFAGDQDACLALASELAEVSARYGFRSTAPHAEFQIGWAQAAGGRLDAGIERMEGAERTLSTLGQNGSRHLYLAAIAAAHARAHRLERALATIDRAIAVAESAGIESWRPELLRQRTAWRLAVQMIDFAGAKAEWLAALAMARRQSAGTFTLRIATDLARASKRTDDAEWAAHQLAESIAELDATRMSGPDLAFPDRRVALETLADLRHD